LDVRGLIKTCSKREERNEEADLVFLRAAALAVGSGAAWSDDKVVTPQPLVPSFRVDPFWPKTLPNKWLVGAVAGVAVDPG
jgi:hypothetical protein